VIQASTSSRASIRKATEADAEAIVSILEGIVSERIYSAIESAWSAETPGFLIEMDCTQDQGNHVHSVWRDYENDFGLDLLKAHYSASH
jgi:Protein of unknown function (DUF3500)